MRNGRGFPRYYRAKNGRPARRPKTRACSSRPCAGGPGAGCRGGTCRPRGLAPGTRCTPAFGAGGKPACGRLCWPRCKTRRACTGSWSIPRPCGRTRWPPARKKRQPHRVGARPQPGRFHDQALPELRRAGPDLRPGLDQRPGRRLPASPGPAGGPPAPGPSRAGRPGLRCGRRAGPNPARRGRGRDSQQEKPHPAHCP